MNYLLPLATGIPVWQSNLQYFIYTGIGSKETPLDVCAQMTDIAVALYKMGFSLRSGHAPGADQAFERGSLRSEIYLPWPRFEGSNSPLYHVTDAALALAQQFHSGWEYLSVGSRKLIARDGYQVLGYDLHVPSRFVVCWTEGGRVVGGTGQALRIAQYYKIPVFNLAKVGKYDVLNFARALTASPAGKVPATV